MGIFKIIIIIILIKLLLSNSQLMTFTNLASGVLGE